MAWLIGVLAGVPIPMLLFTGGASNGKSYMADRLASLFAGDDMDKRYNQSFPKSIPELHRNLLQGMVTIFDNVGTIPADISNDICRIIDGGKITGYGPQFTAYGSLQWPRIIMTALANPVETEDLASRTLIVDVDDTRHTQDQPIRSTASADKVLHDIGVHLVNVMQASQNLDINEDEHPSLTLKKLSDSQTSHFWLPKFLNFLLQVERLCAHDDSMAQAVIANITDTDQAAAEDEPLVILLLALMTKCRKTFVGTASKLQDELLKLPEARRFANPIWLRNPRSLGTALKKNSRTLKGKEFATRKSPHVSTKLNGWALQASR